MVKQQLLQGGINSSTNHKSKRQTVTKVVYGASISSVDEEDQTQEYYNVESILEKKKVGKKTYYLVKWEGYSKEEATWEPITNLRNVKDMVKQFEAQLIYRNDKIEEMINIKDITNMGQDKSK